MSYGLAAVANSRNTRLTKLDAPESAYVALILATSGLRRLGLEGRITAILSPPELYHAVGQGALGIEIRSGDERVRSAVGALGHWQTEWRCAAERGCLRVLEGGCSVPVGVETELEEVTTDSSTFPLTIEADAPVLHFSGLTDGSLGKSRPRTARLRITACVTSVDGSEQVINHRPAEVVRSWKEAEELGEACARELREMGAGEILDQIEAVRKERERRDLQQAIRESKEDAVRAAQNGHKA